MLNTEKLKKLLSEKTELNKEEILKITQNITAVVTQDPNSPEWLESFSKALSKELFEAKVEKTGLVTGEIIRLMQL
jgi:hypothetical protein